MAPRTMHHPAPRSRGVQPSKDQSSKSSSISSSSNHPPSFSSCGAGPSSSNSSSGLPPPSSPSASCDPCTPLNPRTKGRLLKSLCVRGGFAPVFSLQRRMAPSSSITSVGLQAPTRLAPTSCRHHNQVTKFSIRERCNLN